MVYADDGSAVDAVDDESSIARRSHGPGGRCRRRQRSRSRKPDQWTVGSGLRNLRPLYKYSFRDGQQVYVNGDTAEVVQYTTTSSRFWAYLGAIPHWMYFTPLRKNQPQWFSFVVWSSLDRHDRRVDRRRDCRLDALAAEALPLFRRADEHSVSRLEAVAHDHRAVVRRRHGDVGVQRPPLDGAVSDHRQVDRI